MVLFCAVATTSALAAPQGLPSLYELVGVGPVAAPQCSCVAAPFTLPAYLPDTRFHLGAATPAARGRTFPDPVLLSSSDASTFFAYHYLHGLGIQQNDGAAALDQMVQAMLAEAAKAIR